MVLNLLCEFNLLSNHSIFKMGPQCKSFYVG